MAIKRRPGRGVVKSETLTVRLEEKGRFALDFITRINGQPIGSWIERTALAQILASSINDKTTYREIFGRVWHDEPGVRALAIANEEDLFPKTDELKILHFAKQFWPFFYKDREFSEYHVPRIQILWPHIHRLVGLFESTRGSDFFAVADEMSALLKNAGLEVPNDEDVREAGR